MLVMLNNVIPVVLNDVPEEILRDGDALETFTVLSHLCSADEQAKVVALIGETKLRALFVPIITLAKGLDDFEHAENKFDLYSRFICEKELVLVDIEELYSEDVSLYVRRWIDRVTMLYEMTNHVNYSDFLNDYLVRFFGDEEEGEGELAEGEDEEGVVYA